MTRQRADDSGSMLVELLVAMVLMSVVGVLVLDAIVSGFSTQKQLQDRGEALENVRRIAQRVTRDIREAAPVIEAKASSLTVSHATSTGTMTRYWWIETTSGTSVLKQRTVNVTGTTTVTDVTQTIVGDLDASSPTFTYDPIPGYASNTSSINSSTCVITPSSPTKYSTNCVGKVTLHLTRKVEDHTPVTVSAAVDLRNVS